MKNEVSAAEAAIQLNNTYMIMKWKHDSIWASDANVQRMFLHFKETLKAWLSLI